MPGGSGAATASTVARPPTTVATSVPDTTDVVGPATMERAEEPYEWSTVPIGAGGYVTGLVTSSAADGEHAMYARTDVGGAYRWQSDEQRWHQILGADALGPVEPAPSAYSVASIATAPDDGAVVYVAVGDDFEPGPEDAELARTGRVLASRDGGRTWTTSDSRWFINGNQRFRVGAERLAVHPSNPDRVVFASQREGLWRSSDGGASWSQVPLEQLPSGVAADGVGEQAGVNFAAYAAAGDTVRLFTGVANVGVFVSDDEGDSWRQLLELVEGEVPASPVAANGALLVAVHTPAAAQARLLRIDAITSDIAPIDVPANAIAWHVAVDPDDAEHLVLADDAVRDGHLWTSHDGGHSWEAHDVQIDSPEIPWLERTDLDQYMSTGRLVFDTAQPGRVWFAEGMAVWRSDDIDAATVTWESAALGIEETVVSDLVVLPDGAAIVTVADRQGFRLETNRSFPIQPLVDDRFASGSAVAYSSGSPNVLAWVGAESNVPTSPDRTERGAVSRDGGITWTEMSGLQDDMYGGEVAVSSTDSATIVWVPTHHEGPAQFESDPVGLFVSHDQGKSWTRGRVDGAVDSFHRFFWWFTRTALAADAVTGAFYLLSDEERFYISDDGARTWTQAPHSPPCSVRDDCHVVGQLQAVPGAARQLWAGAGTAGLYRTADAGQSPWVRIEGVTEAIALTFGAPVGASDDPTVFLYGRLDGDTDRALWRSDDLGRTWTLISRFPGDLANRVNVIAGDPSTPGRVYVGFAGNGVVVGDPAA